MNWDRLPGHSHPRQKTSPSIHGDSHFSGMWERRFTTLAGAIHTLAGPIHTLVHTFWQGMAKSVKTSPFPHKTSPNPLSRRCRACSSNLVHALFPLTNTLLSCFSFCSIISIANHVFLVEIAAHTAMPVAFVNPLTVI